MAYFDSQNGWIQLVFANEEDTYFLPSMMRVNLQRYLFYCLKRAGYGAVYFWSESEEKPELSYMDSESAQYYEKIRPQGIWEKLLGGMDGRQGTECSEWTSVRMASDNAMEQFFYQAVDGKKKTAIVVPIGVFDRFFQNGKAAALIERNRHQKSSKSLLLITSSACSGDSSRYLTREDGILCKLLEEVRQAVTAGTGLNIYEAIQLYMGEKCLYLNSLNRDMIRNIVRRRLLFDGRDNMPVSWRLLEQITDVIEWYYHSPDFRRKTPVSLPENKRGEFKVIDNALQNTRTVSVIRDWIEQTGERETEERFQSYLKQAYPREKKTCFIYADSLLMLRWEQLIIPEDISPVKHREWNQRLESISGPLKALVLRGDEDLDRENLDACIEQMRKSLNNRDMQTFQYAVRAMQYLVDTYYDQDSSREDVWKFYRKIFELSEEIQKLEQEIAEHKKQIIDNRTEMYHLFERIEVLEQQYNDMDGGELDVLRQKAMQCDEDIRTLNGILTLKNNQCFQYQQAITSVQQGIQSATRGGVVDVQLILEKAIVLQQKALSQNFKIIQELEQTAAKNPERMERLTGQKSVETKDLEARYRELEAKMKDLK